MRVFTDKIQRWVALIVCVCFTASLFPEAYAAIPSLQMAVKSETPRILNIDIPTELASVDEWYQAPSTPKPKLIVHIQDAHSNYEAQTHIRDVIKYLNTNYGFKTILVEGAASELDPGILKLFPDQERNLKLVDELAKIGEVTGAEMFLVENSSAAQGLGIEKPELYRKNFDALQKVYSADEFVSGFFEAYEKKLGQIASRSFGPRLIQALAEWRKFENGHRDFLPFVSNLAELSKKVLNLDLGVLYSQIEWPQLTRLLVLQRLEKELEQTNAKENVKQQAASEKQIIIGLLKAANKTASTPGVKDPQHREFSLGGLISALERFDEKTANLNRIGAAEVRQESAPRALIEALVEEGGKIGLDIRDYPAFAKYAGYLILRSEIVPGALFEEIKKLFDRILETLVKEPPSSAKQSAGDEAARKRLLLLHRDEMLASKLLKLELSHDEWLAILSRQERFYPDDLNRRMLEQLGENTRSTDGDPKKEDRMKKLNESFRAACTFYSAAINRETYFFQRIQETLAKTDKAILITGGFHAEGMKDLMRKYDINYGTLTPRITKEFSNETYRKVMMTGLDENKEQGTKNKAPEQVETPRGLPQASPEVAKSNAKHLKNSKSRKLKTIKENYLGVAGLLNRAEVRADLEGSKRSEVRSAIIFSTARMIDSGIQVTESQSTKPASERTRAEQRIKLDVPQGGFKKIVIETYQVTSRGMGNIAVAMKIRDGLIRAHPDAEVTIVMDRRDPNTESIPEEMKRELGKYLKYTVKDIDEVDWQNYDLHIRAAAAISGELKIAGGQIEAVGDAYPVRPIKNQIIYATSSASGGTGLNSKFQYLKNGDRNINYVPMNFGSDGLIPYDEGYGNAARRQDEMSAEEIRQERAAILEKAGIKSGAKDVGILDGEWLFSYFQNAGVFLSWVEAIKAAANVKGDSIDVFSVPGGVINRNPETRQWIKEELKGQGIQVFDHQDGPIDTAQSSEKKKGGIRVFLLQNQDRTGLRQLVVNAGKPALSGKGMTRKYPSLVTGDNSFLETLSAGIPIVHDWYNGNPNSYIQGNEGVMPKVVLWIKNFAPSDWGNLDILWRPYSLQEILTVGLKGPFYAVKARLFVNEKAESLERQKLIRQIAGEKYKSLIRMIVESESMEGVFGKLKEALPARDITSGILGAMVSRPNRPETRLEKNVNVRPEVRSEVRLPEVASQAIRFTKTAANDFLGWVSGRQNQTSAARAVIGGIAVGVAVTIVFAGLYFFFPGILAAFLAATAWAGTGFGLFNGFEAIDYFFKESRGEWLPAAAMIISQVLPGKIKDVAKPVPVIKPTVKPATPTTFENLKSLPSATTSKAALDTAQLILNLIDLADDAEKVNLLLEKIAGLLGQTNIKISDDGGLATKLKYAVPRLKIKLLSFKVKEVRSQAQGSNGGQRVSNSQIIASLDAALIEALSQIRFEDMETISPEALEAFLNKEKEISPVMAVVFLAKGFVAIDAPDDAKTFIKLAAIAAAQSSKATEQSSELADMLRAFFPSLASDKNGLQIEIMHESEWASQENDLMMTAMANPDLEIRVFLESERGGVVKSSLGNLIIVNKKDVSREANTYISKLPPDRMALFYLSKGFEENNFKGVGDRVTFAKGTYNRADPKKNFAAAIGKARKAQQLSNPDMVIDTDENVFDPDRRDLIITDESLAGALRALAGVFQAILKIRQSA